MTQIRDTPKFWRPYCGRRCHLCSPCLPPSCFQDDTPGRKMAPKKFGESKTPLISSLTSQTSSQHRVVSLRRSSSPSLKMSAHHQAMQTSPTSIALAALHQMGSVDALRLCDELKAEAQKAIKFRALVEGSEAKTPCQGITTKGVQCSRSAVGGYCWQHVKKNAGALASSYASIPAPYFQEICQRLYVKLDKSKREANRHLPAQDSHRHHLSEADLENGEEDLSEEEDAYAQPPTPARQARGSLLGSSAMRQQMEALLAAHEKKQASFVANQPPLQVRSVMVTPRTQPALPPRRLAPVSPPPPPPVQLPPQATPVNRYPALHVLNLPVPADAPDLTEEKRPDAADADAEESEEEQAPEPNPRLCGDYGGLTAKGTENERPCRNPVLKGKERCHIKSHQRQK
jgi:hypothetical protein